MARHKVGLVDVVGAPDRRVAEAQMADGYAARFLGVVLEVRLNILVGVVADNLDGVLVRTHGAIAAQAPELALDGTRSCGVGAIGIFGKAQIRNIVHNANGETRLGSIFLQLFVHGEQRRRRRVLRAQTVTTARYRDTASALRVQRAHNILEQRLAHGARLFRAVQNGNLRARCRNGRNETVGSKRTIQTHLDQADFFAMCIQVINDFFRNIADRTHGNNHTIGIFGAIVIEQLVICAQLGVHRVHAIFHNLRQLIIMAVAGLAMLEEYVAVFVRTACRRMFRIQAMLAEVAHGIHIAQLFKVLVIPQSDFLDLMGGTETIKEVQKRHATLNGRQVCNCGEVHDFLHVTFGKHGKTGLATCHNVGMVAKDVKRLGCHGASAYMEHARELLGCNLVHVRDHQKQTLGSSVRCGQGARRQRTVHNTRCAAFRLHFANFDRSAEDIFLALSCPLVNIVGHRARRRNGVNACNFRERIGDICCRIVAIHGFKFSCHTSSP